MMKLSLAILSLIATSANAFVPAGNSVVIPSSLSMAKEEAEAPAVEEAEEAEAVVEEEVPVAKKKVPCFGATPFVGGPKFVGENYWDKITTEWGSEATGQFVQAAELKHGRSAMLAVLGFAFHKFGWTFNNISIHTYLSETQGVKFADLQAMSPLDAIKAVPPEGLTQMFAVIALIELYELTYKNGKIAEDVPVAPGLRPYGLNGDLAWNPLDIKITDRRRLAEIQNGRAATFCISAWIAADAVPGSVPLPLPW